MEILAARTVPSLGLTVVLSLLVLWPWGSSAKTADVGLAKTPEVGELEEIVITASRAPKAAFDEPYTVAVIDRQELREFQSRTTPEALRLEPGVMVQKTAHGHGAPYIRGFTGLQTLFMVDGIRLNNSVFRPGPNQYWNTVDSLSIKRLELIKGPSSVLYGSDAIGGTVNVLTKSPFDQAEDDFGGELSYRVSSAENSHIGRGEFHTLFGERLGILLGVSAKEFGDVVGGDSVGKQEKTGYDEHGVDLKAEYRLDDDTRLVAAYQRVRQNNAPRTHKTIYGIDWRGLSVGSEFRRDLDQERDLAYLQLHMENLNNIIDAAHLSFSWHKQEEIRDRVRSKGRDVQDFYVGQVGASAQLESDSPLGDLIYGIEYYRDNVNSSSSSNAIQGPVADDARYDLLGVYVQDSISFARDRLDLLLGARYTYAEADADSVRDPETGSRISMEDDWNAFVGSARLLWHVDAADHWNLFTGVSQGFRAPNLSDLTRFDSARTNEIETAATDLDPEYYLTFEVGTKTRYKAFSGQAAYFYTFIKDAIVRVPTGNTIDGEFEVTKDNIGDGFVHGVELEGRYRFHPQWTLSGALSWIDGEMDTYPTSARFKKSEPLDRLMPPTGHAGLRWDHPSQKFWLEGVLSIARRQDDLSTRDRSDTSRIPPHGTPGYQVISLYGGWDIREDLELSFALENLFDEDYRIHGSGLNQPGTNLVLGLEYRF